MQVLKGLEPQKVFGYFEELSSIPRGSGHTRAVSDHCAAFARQRGLQCWQDAANNLIIKKPAAPGYGSAAPVILQGHLDMVCEKTPDCPKDLEREGLDLFVEGDLVGARGTTLGADDGIAVAMALAILDSDSIPHPPLEVLLTVDEEVGMLGAAALDPAPLQGRQLLNLDSESEGVLTVSCAGGNVTECVLPVHRAPFEGQPMTLTVGGLTGGHSGAEIDKGRGNSNLLMGRVLCALQDRTGFRLVSAEGGFKDNAIPRQTAARLVAADRQAVLDTAARMSEAFARELHGADPGVFVKAEEGPAAPWQPLDAASTAAAVCLLCCAPNGIQAMSTDIPGLVQTSLNLGILKTAEDALSAAFCVRSSLATQKEMLTRRLECLTRQLGGSIRVTGDYPAWEYKADSALRRLMVQVYRDQYGSEPRVEAIHAGVECGLLCGKLPGLDCVSFGPDLREIHTPRERMSIASVQRVWNYTLEVLRRCR